MEPTTLAIAMAATVGAVKLFDGLIAIIKLLVARRNGKPKTQSMLENRLIDLMDAKQDKPVCEEKHKSVDEKTSVLFDKVDGMAKQVNDIYISVIKGG